MTLVWLLLLLSAALLLTAPLTRLLGRNTGWPLALVFLAGVGLLLPHGGDIMDGRPLTWSVPWVPQLGVELALRADGLGLVFTMIALVIGAVVFLYSTRYLEPGRQLSFYLVMTAFTLSMVGLALSDDLILLFLCWELTSLASFLLIARSGSAGQSASMRTLLVTFVGGLTLLAAVTAVIVRTGTTNVTEALASEVWTSDPAFTAAMAVLVLLSAFTKSAQFPFHPWLPDAMAAATPVSAYLHAAAVVKAGIFLLMRFSPAFHATPAWNYTLIAVGLFTAAMGALFALQKTDLKKLMAYSTVSQLGLIVATIGIGTEAALAAAILHTIAHALFKSGLFMLVGVIDHQTGSRDIRRLGTLWRQMPWTCGAMVVGAASMAGVPPTLGFISKESIFVAMREAPGPAWVGWAALVGAVGATMLTIAYCAKIVFGAFVDGPRDVRDVAEAGPGLLLPAAAPAVVGLPLAFVAFLLDRPVGAATRSMLSPDAADPHLVLWHGLTLELGLTALVMAAGGLPIWKPRRVRTALERDLLPVDGVSVIAVLIDGARATGRALTRPTRTDVPSRHLAPPMAVLVLLGGAALLAGPVLPPTPDNLARPIDGVLLILVALGVLGMCRSVSRLGATVFLGGVGIAVTVQMFALGAPDVGMTQLLVEVLTVIVLLLVLRKLPVTFDRTVRPRRHGALALAVLSGAVAGLAVWALTGRRERSDVARYYLEQGPEITGGDNVVNTILVEFRALDTLGELTVLGMAGVAIVALISTIRPRYLDPPPDPWGSVTLTTGAPGQAREALTSAERNTVPLRLLVRALVPALALISLYLLWRGHNAPGGGFIAALVASAAIAMVYLARTRDAAISGRNLPTTLVAAGVLTALGIGMVGYTSGSFLAPLHTTVAGVSLSTGLIFDIGVYLAVLGMVMVTLNRLGTGSGHDPDGSPSEGEDAGPDAEHGSTGTPAAGQEQESDPGPITGSAPRVIEEAGR